MNINIIRSIYLIFIISFLFKYYYSSVNNSHYENYLNNCLNYKLSDREKSLSIKYDYGKDLWKEILAKSNISLCIFLKNMRLFKYNNSFYYHRLYSKCNRSDINVKGSFPDKSYYRLIPKNKNNYKNVVTHTYEVQEYIYSYQHPLTCTNKRFLIIKGFEFGGHGSEIHVLTSYLALAISLNRIALLDIHFVSMKGYGTYCTREKNWLCFLEQFTNCSLPYSLYKTASKYININQTEKYIYIINDGSLRFLIPEQILKIMRNSNFNKYQLLHYWRIQASTFIFRLNKRANIETNKIIKKSLKNKLFNGCFNIWVRHGDKYIEMKLLDSKEYISSYKIYKKVYNKNIPIYLSTDDPKVISFYDNLNSTEVYYLHFLRRNDHFKYNMQRGDEMTLNFIADIKAALYCNGFSGTRKSNVVRLIDELRSTVGLSANAIYFENGNIKVSDAAYENYEYW